jgi:hypothetical protein
MANKKQMANVPVKLGMAAPRTENPRVAGTPDRCTDPPDNVDWLRRAIYW